MQRHLLAIAVILTVASGCDNVAWGGVEVELQPPPTTEVEPVEEEEAVVEEAPPRIPGPMLLAGFRDGSRATLSVVGEIRGDSLSPFPHPDFPEDSAEVAERLSIGSEWILFGEGVRVGRLTVDEVGSAEQVCTPWASVSGTVELVPDAGGVERVLALSADQAARRDFGAYAALQRDYDQGVASLNIVGEVIPRVGAEWPEQGTLASRQDIQAIQLPELGAQAVLATFLYRDRLAVAPPGQGAYAIFLMGVPGAGGYREAYSWYRAADVEGKGVPRYFSHLDWNGDGDSEILLEVLGSNRRWYASLGQQQGEWVRTFQGACGSGAPSAE